MLIFNILDLFHNFETAKIIHVYVRSKYFCNNLSFTNLNN